MLQCSLSLLGELERLSSEDLQVEHLFNSITTGATESRTQVVNFVCISMHFEFSLILLIIISVIIITIIIKRAQAPLSQPH